MSAATSRSRRVRTAAAILAAGAVLGLAGCGGGSATPSAPKPAAATGSTAVTFSGAPTSAVPAGPSSAPTSTAPAAAAQQGHGLVVVLDPGHNGGNASHPAQINAQVPAGRGQTKACNTTGTATAAGYTEHAFNWDVASRVQAILVAHGYRVVLTRPNDTGVGPCVNQRAAIGNQAAAAAVVSIHADGSDSAGAHGFHVEYSNPPLNASQGAPSIRLAEQVRAAMTSAGFSTANYIGSDGLFGRSDLGGLNLSDRPTALIECGNMHDAADAATLSGVAGRQRIATAVAAAIMAYLGG